MTLRLLVAICLTLLATTGLSEPTDEVVRPKYEIDLSNPYSTDSVPTYAGDHQAVYQHIDDNIDAHTEALQRWLRQPSISAQNVGIREMAELVRSDLEAIGFQEAEFCTVRKRA